jgi:hypothetical protein
VAQLPGSQPATPTPSLAGVSAESSAPPCSPAARRAQAVQRTSPRRCTSAITSVSAPRASTITGASPSQLAGNVSAPLSSTPPTKARSPLLCARRASKRAVPVTAPRATQRPSAASSTKISRPGSSAPPPSQPLGPCAAPPSVANAAKSKPVGGAEGSYSGGLPPLAPPLAPLPVAPTPPAPGTIT